MEDDKSTIQKFLDRISAQSITLDNVNKVDDSINNNLAIVGTQLDSYISQFNSKIEEVKKMKEEQKYKAAKEEGFIPFEVNKLHTEMIKIMKSAYSWLTLRSEIVEVASSKKSDVLGEQRAFSLKKDMLVEMREDLKQRDQFMRDLFLSRIKGLEDKYYGNLELIEKRHEIETKQHLLLVKDIVKLVETSILTKTDVPKQTQKEIIDVLNKRVEQTPQIISDEIAPIEQEFMNTTREVQEVTTPNYHKEDLTEVENVVEVTPEDNIDDIDKSFQDI